MIQVIDGQVRRTVLPKSGTLSTGETVSNYNLLSETILKEEGWLLLEDNPPEYDKTTQQLLEDGYDILADRVIKKYRIEEYEQPKNMQTQLDELQNVLDALLGGE